MQGKIDCNNIIETSGVKFPVEFPNICIINFFITGLNKKMSMKLYSAVEI